MESLRQFLRYLEDKGDLARVKQEVSPIYDVGRIERKYNGKETVWFENILGYSQPIVSGIFNKRDNIATALGVEYKELRKKIIQSVNNPGRTKTVKEAPVQEVIEEKVNLLKTLPIPKHYAKDKGRYITCGVILAKDPETGVRNLSFARMHVREDGKISIMVNQRRHLLRYFNKAEAQGDSLDVAIIIGPHPAVCLEGAMPDGLVPDNLDEMDIASSLMGQPLDVIKGKTIDLAYPAEAEIVIEGKMLFGVREYEGPFGDYAGIYDPSGENPVIEVTALVRRKDAIYQDLLPYTFELYNLGGVPREVDLLNRIQKAVPEIKDIHLTPGGCSRFHAVVQISKEREFDASHAVIATLFPTEAANDIKLVVVVDEDIDIYNPNDVEWAIATRVQWDKDIFVIPKMLGMLDPSAFSSTPTSIFDQGTVLSSKIGIDATIPLDRPDCIKFYERVGFPPQPETL
jgi:2,5-furandicarboxylate decarboxylase 1